MQYPDYLYPMLNSTVQIATIQHPPKMPGMYIYIGKATCLYVPKQKVVVLVKSRKLVRFEVNGMLRGRTNNCSSVKPDLLIAALAPVQRQPSTTYYKIDNVACNSEAFRK